MVWFDQDYVIRLIQKSQDKKSLLTHVHRRHRREVEEHKVNNKKIKKELLLRKTIVTIEFQEQKMNRCDRQLVQEAKSSKSDPEGWHDRVAGGTGRAKSLTWGMSYFCNKSSYFHPESAPNPFLLLQDSIFQLFVPKI